MAKAPPIGRVSQMWRYYQAGIVNTAFGYCAYATLVAVGLNMYLAQLIAHVLGVAFNYFTYSRYAFRDTKASKLRFVLSYGANYLLGLASLAAAAQAISSPYFAGLVAVVFVSLVNYFILKHLVFVRTPAT